MLTFAFLVFMISRSEKMPKISTTCSYRLLTIHFSNEVGLFFPPLKYTVNIIPISEPLQCFSNYSVCAKCEQTCKLMQLSSCEIPDWQVSFSEINQTGVNFEGMVVFNIGRRPVLICVV
jgi:hypothetical protein